MKTEKLGSTRIALFSSRPELLLNVKVTWLGNWVTDMGEHEHTLQLPESSQQVTVGNLLMRNEKCPGKQKAAECSPIWYLQNDNQSREQYPTLFPKIKKKKEVTKVIQLSKGATRLLTKEA